MENKVSKLFLVSLELQEMKQMEDIKDGWYTRIKHIKNKFSIPEFKQSGYI